MNPVVIETIHVSKRYPAHSSPPGFKEWIIKLPQRLGSGENPTFAALDSINLKITKGECVGVIGKNGAGKSTLLSLLLGTSVPTDGTVRVDGKRTPLLELGAGFHPDLTGRENIFINAVLLGLTRAQVSQRLDKIVAFSEIEPFIDMPVRTYSNGMYLRLAFSVAIHTEPEILLIDEVLAVGDESFQRKSESAILSLIQSGVTTVFVSHNLQAVQKICHRALWIHQGQIREEGDSQSVVNHYLKAASSSFPISE